MDLIYWSYKKLPNTRKYQKLNMKYFAFITTEFAGISEKWKVYDLLNTSPPNLALSSQFAQFFCFLALNCSTNMRVWGMEHDSVQIQPTDCLMYLAKNNTYYSIKMHTISLPWSSLFFFNKWGCRVSLQNAIIELVINEYAVSQSKIYY